MALTGLLEALSLPGLKPAKMVVTGIDIGTGAIKLVQLERRGGAAPLVHTLLWKELPLAMEPRPAGDTTVSEALQELAGHCAAPMGQVQMAIAGPSTVITRFLTLPRMTPAELTSSLALEGESYIPFKLSEVVMDHQIVGEAPGNKIRVVLVAVKKEVVDQRMVLLERLSAPPAGMDVDSFALVNAFLRVPPAEALQASVALLNSGCELSNLAIVKRGELAFVRDLQWGGRAVTRSIAEQAHVEPAEAESLKRRPSDQVKQILAGAAENLLAEIRLSFDYFENQHEDSVTRMYVSGGSAGLAGLPGLLQEQLGLKAVECWNPLAGLAMAPAVAEAPITQPGQFAVAVGLALRQD